jgi:hypothetical protein
MKLSTIPFLFVTLYALTTGCKSKSSSDAEKLAKDIQSTVKKNSPGTVATSAEGYFMKAKIDGKEWNAAYMMPDESASSSYKTIHGETGETYINFMIWRNGIKLGMTDAFGEGNAPNLSVEGVSGFWGGKSGELKITRVDEKWLEGNFQFDATSSSEPGKTIRVTDGSFRVPLQNIR